MLIFPLLEILLVLVKKCPTGINFCWYPKETDKNEKCYETKSCHIFQPKKLKLIVFFDLRYRGIFHCTPVINDLSTTKFRIRRK